MHIYLSRSFSIFCVDCVSMALFSAHSPAFLFSNIGNLISIKLDSRNHLLWKSQFLPVLRAHGMVGFVDGSCICPPEFVLDSPEEVNPQRIKTFFVGSMLLFLLLSWLMLLASKLQEMFGLHWTNDLLHCLTHISFN